MKAFQRLSLVSATTLLGVLAASCSFVPHGPSIQIEADSWSAEPTTMEVGSDSFSILVSNNGTTREEFVVVQLTGADPDALPMRDGQLDMSNPTGFFVAYPEPARAEGRESGAELVLVPALIDPDEYKKVTLGSFKGGGEPATYVVMSCKTGGYEAGRYAVFTISG